MGRISFTDAYYGVESKIRHQEPEFYKTLSQTQLDIEDYKKLRRLLTELYIEAYIDVSGHSPSVSGSYLDIELQVAYDVMDDIKRLRETKGNAYSDILAVLFLGLPDTLVTQILLAISVSFIVLYFSLSRSEKKRLEEYAFYDLIEEIIC